MSALVTPYASKEYCLFLLYFKIVIWISVSVFEIGYPNA